MGGMLEEGYTPSLAKIGSKYHYQVRQSVVGTVPARLWYVRVGQQAGVSFWPDGCFSDGTCRWGHSRIITGRDLVANDTIQSKETAASLPGYCVYFGGQWICCLGLLLVWWEVVDGIFNLGELQICVLVFCEICV